MNKSMKKIIFYSIISIILFGLFILEIYCFILDFQKSVEIVAKIIQSLAIIIGGLWAYHKFGWDKKCENIIKLKAALMEFNWQHNISAAQFRIDNDMGSYRLRLLNSYRELQNKIHLSYYVPKKLRDKIFDTIWLTIGNVHGEKLEKLNENWDKFEKQIKEIYKEFDSVVD